MKKFLLCCSAAAFLLSCNNSESNDKSKTTASTDSTNATATNTAAVDLPYTASYSSSFTDNVSDADLKTVLVSYKDWADGNMDKVAKAYGDTLEWVKTDGGHFRLPNAGIIKMWTTFRDSLSSVSIDMQAWKKMYATDKKSAFVVTWYKEIDTYKGGKADSAYYHDINGLDNGKIISLEQYRRGAK